MYHFIKRIFKIKFANELKLQKDLEFDKCPLIEIFFKAHYSGSEKSATAIQKEGKSLTEVHAT